MKLKDILDFPRSREYVLHTDLGIEECAARLKNTVMKEANVFGRDYEISSTVNAEKFTVKTTDPYRMKHSVFWGRMEQSKTGTNISGYFAMEPLLKFFFWLLSAFFLLIFPVYLVLSFILFILIVVLSVANGCHMPEIEENPVMHYLKVTLGATQISPIPGPSENTCSRDEYLDENYVFYSRQFSRRK